MNDFVIVDNLFVADHAEVVNGKLYVLGGGWTDLSRPIVENATYLNTFGVVLSILVPWTELNRLHTITVRLESQDDKKILAEARSPLNVGGMPTLSEGTEQHVAGAITFNIPFPTPGNYQVTATIDNDDDNRKEWRFRVHDVKMGP